MDELELAHVDYEQRKAKVLDDLTILYDSTVNIKEREMLKGAIDLIKEREI